MLAAFIFSLLNADQATPAPVAAPFPGGAPITINTCVPMVDKSGPTVAGVSLTSTSSGIHIQFTNESQKAADLINFEVNSNGTQFVIRDVGTFSPGIEIDHKYRNGAGQAFVLPAFIAPNVTCSVASIRFTDGTTWQRGNPEPLAGVAQPHPRLAASPTRVNVARSADSELFMVSSSEQISAFRETDDCANVAAIFVAATGQSTATYSVKPLAAGSCTARITDEAGNALFVPVTVRP